MCTYSYTVTEVIKNCNHNNKKFLLRSEFGDRYILLDDKLNLIFDVHGDDSKITALFNSYHISSKKLSSDEIKLITSNYLMK